MNAIAAGAATAAAGMWVVAWAWTVYDTIQSDGSWYNELKMNDRNTFINRAIVTFRDRMIVWKSVGAMLSVSVIVWSFTYVFTLGLLTLLG